MKAVASIILLALATSMTGQRLPTHVQILRSLFGDHYDSATENGVHHCPANAEDRGCSNITGVKNDLSVVLLNVMEDDRVRRAYTVAEEPEGTDCHTCAPRLRIGIFVYQHNQWELESSGFTTLGAWDEPPDMEIVKVGPDRYGVMFTWTDGGQGYLATTAALYTTIGSEISDVWSGILWADNHYSYDPTRKYGSKDRIQVTAAYRFVHRKTPSGYFDLEVLSRGRGLGEGAEVVSQTWSKTYRFKSGKYELLKATDFREVPLKH